MVKAKQLVEEYKKQFGKTYDDMDCITSISNIIKRYGGKYDLNGSNHWARYEIKNLRPLTNKDQLYDGAAILKTVHPNEPGYNLPDRYKNHAIQIDYNHIGLGTDDGRILDSTKYGQQKDGSWERNGPGWSSAKIGPNSWDLIGDFEDVDYSDRGINELDIDDPYIEDEMIEFDKIMMVTAENGGSVNLRKYKKASGVVLEYVPLGTFVVVLESDDTWSRVRTVNDKTGWMMNKFLTAPPIPVGDPIDEPSFEEKVGILWDDYIKRVGVG